jgi:heme-degrading monooxygenase HmoA
MYASVTTEKAKLDKLDEAASAWRDLLTEARPQGLKGAYYLHDRQSGEVVIVGLWNTEADARAFETSGGFQQAVGKLAAYLDEAPTRKVYELAAHVGE